MVNMCNNLTKLLFFFMCDGEKRTNFVKEWVKKDYLYKNTG